MTIKNLYIRSRNLIVQPAAELARVSAENKSISEINKGIVFPFSLLIALCALIYSAVMHFSLPIHSFLFVFLNALIVFLIVFMESYISGKVIILLARGVNRKNQHQQVYALVIYAHIPFYLSFGFVKLFPPLMFLVFLGLYGGWIFYNGFNTLVRVPTVKKLSFLLLSLILITIFFIIIAELFTLGYSEIVNQFSTFAA